MLGPLARGLKFSFVLSLSPVATLLGCSDDGESSLAPADAGSGGGGAGSGSGGGGAGSGSGGAGRSGTGGIRPAGGRTNGGGAGGQGGAKPVDAAAPDAEASTLDGSRVVDAAGPDSSDGSASFIANAPYAIAYTSLPGTDSQSWASVTAQFASTRELTEFMYITTIAPTIGTNVASEVYMDSIAALGRWSGGTAGGTFNVITLTWTADQGLHYVIGVPTPLPSLPATGTADFDLLAATHPTVHLKVGSPGTVTGGSVRVAYGKPSKVGLTLSVTMSVGDYTIATTGGTSDPSTSELTFPGNNYMWGNSAPATGTGPPCGGSCAGHFFCFFGGSGAERLGCAFAIKSSGDASTVRGAVLFGKR